MKKLLFFTISTLISILSYSQNGEIDTTFNPGDLGFGSGEGFNSDVYSIALQDDEKILVGGYFSSYNGTSRNTIGRLKPDGTLDTTFEVGSGFDDLVNTLAVQSDGKIIVGGGFSWFNTFPYGMAGVFRLNPDGTGDFSFNLGESGIGMGGIVNSVAIQSDGKIIVGGGFTTYNGLTRNCIVRINTDGYIDTTFDTGTGFDGEVNSVVVQSTGEILVGGTFTSFNGTARNKITRLNTDGTLDTSFEPGSGFNNPVSSLTVQSDGKILVGGSFSSYNGTSINHFARINLDGTLDTSFGSGTSFNNNVTSVAVQNDGKILVGGQFSDYNGTPTNRIARINSDGTIDNSFSIGTGLDNEVNSFAIQNDDKIILGGNFDSFDEIPRHKIARLNTDGTNDFEFNPLTGFNNSVWTLALQNDGKVVAGGTFSDFKETTQNRIALLNSDGELNATFDSGTGFSGIGSHDVVNSVAVQNDGKTIVGGGFNLFNGTSINRIARLNVDGSLDTSFDIGTGFFGYVYAVAVQSDGKIIVGGEFSEYNGTLLNDIARLNTDGTLDTSFDQGTGFNNFVETISIQDDGKILVGGWFSGFNGTSINKIARLNPNGTLDTSFDPGTGFNERVRSIVILDDGRIVVGGFFTSFNGITQNRVTRLNGNGTRDISFDPGTGFNGWVYSVAVQSDGKIIAAGEFDSYNGISRNNISRLLSDGTLDNSFEIGTGFDRRVYSLVLQSDNKIIAGGNFTSYNGTGRNKIARLHLGCTDVSVSRQWSTITANNPDATYQWIDCSNNNTPISNETSQNFTATQDGDYAVIVSSTENSCVDTSACINIASASLKETINENRLRLYPNPNKGSFTIEASNPIKVEVFNSLGRKNDVQYLQKGKSQFSLENIVSGIYYLHATDELGNRTSRRIVIE